MTVRFLLALCASASFGCLAPDRRFGPIDENCREQVSAEIYEHACQHGRLGPFAMAQAVAVRDAALPTVDGAQRVATIALPGREIDPDGLSYVRYVASRDGRHVLFAGADFQPIEVTLERDGVAIVDTPIEPPNSARCGGMVEVTGYELSKGQAYVVELGPTTAGSAQLFFEHLGTFDEDWSDRCVD